MMKPYYKNARLENKMREMRATGALICHNCDIPEYRFSKILNGRNVSTEEEQKTIAKLLECKVSDIFPNLSDPDIKNK